ncbi:MAG: DUF4442 domain-containing protein [Nonlabens sp.]
MNTFTFFNLPSCWWSGVRCKKIYAEKCDVTVKHNWFNKNPFNSLYFAVQAMAAELTTGALVMFYIKRYDIKLSMLVVENDSIFIKKATGVIRFTCNEGEQIKQAVKSARKTGDPQTIWVESIGRNQTGEEVSRFRFKWSLRLKR